MTLEAGGLDVELRRFPIRRDDGAFFITVVSLILPATTPNSFCSAS